ncbi:MAG: hypothetical protein EON92_13545 [Burkholderiales bacterium]|nr:MAG: hypothetical protein EON92_13545 [Burkholderiales bacterium]
MVLPEAEDEPELVDPIDEPVEEPVAPMVAPLEPVAPALPCVPVVPIGVCCELCCPAPTAGLFTLGLGGVPCAMAEPMTATVARPANRPLMWFDADIALTPDGD